MTQSLHNGGDTRDWMYVLFQAGNN